LSGTSPILEWIAAGVIALGIGGDAAPGESTPAEPGTVVAADTAAAASPLPFWGRVDCEWHDPPLTPAHQVIEAGGDSHPTAKGRPQGDYSFRRLTVYDGDDVFGERCELGLNDHRRGPTAFYREGDRYVTFASLRLPGDTDVNDPDWRVVLQMKQAQPYNNLEGASRFELQVRDGRWLAISDYRDLWSAPAQAGTWTRFRFDVTYSQDPARGSIQISADLNDDGDYVDDVDSDGSPDEESPHIRLATLLRETAGRSESGLAPGESVPSHLRAGIYQNQSFECPRTGPGCSVDIDNVQVLRP
jgi:hypothetical protein